MLSSRFHSLYDGLVEAFVEHDDAPRSPELVPELAQSRLKLDMSRAEIREEGKRLLRERRARKFGSRPRPLEAEINIAAVHAQAVAQN